MIHLKEVQYGLTTHNIYILYTKDVKISGGKYEENKIKILRIGDFISKITSKIKNYGKA